MDMLFFRNKRVLITGHTGFKGAWLCKVLENFGAEIFGYSLKHNTNPNLFDLLGLEDRMTSIIGDIRDLEKLKKVFVQFQPEIVIHLAAQPLVKESYEKPVYTYDVNVMGTVNILECVRCFSCVRSFLNVTTDKVYKNQEWEWGYREIDVLNGYDPYSNSKSCSELVTSSYINSFLKNNTNRHIAVSTARAGNVIGGGDFAYNRIIPDCINATIQGKKIFVRNPNSVRPYQHVLEPIMAYLDIIQKQYLNQNYASNYNIGPDSNCCKTTSEIAALFCHYWNEVIFGCEAAWESGEYNGPHEANMLMLDCSKFKKTFNWTPRWNVEDAIFKIIEWTNVYLQKGNLNLCMDNQINEYIRNCKIMIK